MSNKYVHLLDVPLTSFQRQVETLLSICSGTHPVSTLCEVESKLMPTHWQKSYYEKASQELLEMVPVRVKNILSIGCGWGATEARLQERGAKVTALPLDSVIGATAEPLGIEVIYGTLPECFKGLAGRRFDCVLMTNLLHLQVNPGEFIEHCSRLLQKDGLLVLGGPNFDRLPWLIQRMLSIGEYRKLRSFDLSGFSVCSPKTLNNVIESAGLHITKVLWLDHTFGRGRLRFNGLKLANLTAKSWLLKAQL